MAIAPPAAYVSQGIPFTIEPIVLPNWFRTVAPHLTGHPVVLVLPAPFSATTTKLKWTDATGQSYPLIFSGKQAAMTWQALSGQRFSIVGSGGLGAGTVRPSGENAGTERHLPGHVRLRGAPGRDHRPTSRPSPVLFGLEVDTVVLPDQPELPEYDQVASVPDMAALITGATGLRPTHTAEAWVWKGIDSLSGSTTPASGRFATCTAAGDGSDPALVDRGACMLASNPQAT